MSEIPSQNACSHVRMMPVCTVCPGPLYDASETTTISTWKMGAPLRRIGKGLGFGFRVRVSNGGHCVALFKYHRCSVGVRTLGVAVICGGGEVQYKNERWLDTLTVESKHT